MTCLAISAEQKTPHSDLDIPVSEEISHLAKQDISGPARDAETSEKHDVLLLSVERLLLSYQIKEANRQHRPSSTYKKRLRDVTHQLLGVM